MECPLKQCRPTRAAFRGVSVMPGCRRGNCESRSGLRVRQALTRTGFAGYVRGSALSFLHRTALGIEAGSLEDARFRGASGHGVALTATYRPGPGKRCDEKGASAKDISALSAQSGAPIVMMTGMAGRNRPGRAWRTVVLVVGVAGVAGLLGWTVLTVVFEDREKGGWVAGIAAAPLTGVPLIVALWNWYRRSTAPPAGPGPPAGMRSHARRSERRSGPRCREPRPSSAGRA